MTDRLAQLGLVLAMEKGEGRGAREGKRTETEGLAGQGLRNGDGNTRLEPSSLQLGELLLG